MMRYVQFLPAAEIEGVEAIDWYEEREPGLGRAFRKSVESAIYSIQLKPLAYPVIHGSKIRHALTYRFPYSIIYSIEIKSILIIAIFHQSRNPMIWRERIG